MVKHQEGETRKSLPWNRPRPPRGVTDAITVRGPEGTQRKPMKDGTKMAACVL